MKLYLTKEQSSMLNEIIGAATFNAVQGKDIEVAQVLSDLNKRITPQHSYVKIKKHEVEYLQEFVDGIRVSLDDAITFLNNEEEPRENKEELLMVATRKRDEADQIIQDLKSKI